MAKSPSTASRAASESDVAPLIDFRVRPPYKSFIKSFYPEMSLPAGTTLSVLIQRVFDEEVPSRSQRSFAMFLDELADAGIVRAGLMGRQDGPDLVLNEDIAELVKLYPDLFFGIGGIDSSNPDEAAVEIERCYSLGLIGVALDSPNGANPRRHDDPMFDPLYAQCVDLGLLVCLNGSAHLAADLSYIDPVAVQRVATRFPALTILVAHASWPFVHQMCAIAFQMPNVYLMPDLSRDLPGEEVFEQAAAAGLGEQLLFASSYPGTGLRNAADAYRRRILGAISTGTSGGGASLLGDTQTAQGNADRA